MSPGTGTYSPSAVVWHVGARGALPARAAHHNIHFGAEWQPAFDALFAGSRMPDPSLLVSVPTLDEPSMAPAGAHALYVLEPVPNLDAVDRLVPASVPAFVDDLAAALDRFGYPTDIEAEILVDPSDWQAQGLERGTPFSLSHRFLQSGPFRPSNLERRVPGLVFVGSSTVPGVGVPMVIVSGELAARTRRRR